MQLEAWCGVSRPNVPPVSTDSELVMRPPTHRGCLVVVLRCHSHFVGCESAHFPITTPLRVAVVVLAPSSWALQTAKLLNVSGELDVLVVRGLPCPLSPTADLVS